MEQVKKDLLNKAGVLNRVESLWDVIADAKLARRGKRLKQNELDEVVAVCERRIDEIEADEPVLVEAKEEVEGFAIPQQEAQMELVQVQPVKSATSSMSATLKAHRRAYKTTVEISGKEKIKHVDCNDEVASALRGLPIGDVAQWCADLCGETKMFWLEKYGHLNAGQVRMNLGNKIRAAIKKADALENKEVTKSA